MKLSPALCCIWCRNYPTEPLKSAQEFKNYWIKYFKLMDKDGNGSVDIREYVAIQLAMNKGADNANFYGLFHLKDKNKASQCPNSSAFASVLPFSGP